ncbi:permease-like cell division protein FtsX [Micromonospora sp. URMC 103]|uniref:permease-like cell division protein FtsX n=1 Tax=Micromonospora sp. URMC 103 TaxID=3423406 RepID=UPI003F1AB724
MSEPYPLPSPPEPLPLDVPPGAPESPAPRRRRWIPLVLVGVVAMLVGAGAATAVTLAVTRSEPHEYAVNVYLEQDATPEQKAAIGSALDVLKPVERRFETREQAWAHYKELFKDHPEALAAGSLDAMPESFRLRTRSRTFDCALLAPVRDLPSVDKIQVLQMPRADEAGAEVACG